MQKAVLLWLPDPATRDAIVRQPGRHWRVMLISKRAASEVICSRTPSQMRQFKQIYFSNFSVGLEDDIAYEAAPLENNKRPVQHIHNMYSEFRSYTS